MVGDRRSAGRRFFFFSSLRAKRTAQPSTELNPQGSPQATNPEKEFKEFKGQMGLWGQMKIENFLKILRNLRGFIDEKWDITACIATIFYRVRTFCCHFDTFLNDFKFGANETVIFSCVKDILSGFLRFLTMIFKMTMIEQDFLRKVKNRK
jgi:hypothetical protein